MTAIEKALPGLRPEEMEDPKEHLMHDPRPRGEMNSMMLESMHTTTWQYWTLVIVMSVIVVTCIGYAWYYLIMQGLGVTGVNRPVYWGVFLADFVYWIGLSHSGTLTSAILRVLKIETRRSFTRAAELMTTFAIVQAGLVVFMHMGRVWLSYWMIPIPNERQIWPDFHSPLMWDFMAITTYLLCSSLYLYLPLIPDLAMARDRAAAGWRKVFYKALAIGFRGTEGEWKNLHTAMNIFAFAIIPVAFSVHTIVAWDFAMAMRPGWSSTVFGPYFVIGALQSGVAAVPLVLFVVRATMKHMKYFLRPENFDTVAKMILIISMGWAYFYFNDFLIPWYGGDKLEKVLNLFIRSGSSAWIWYLMLFCNIVVPWSILWRKKWRQTPWLVALVGLLINVGMYLERYMIVTQMLPINYMPFTWRTFIPSVEIILTIGTFALFILMYLAASRLIPLIPVWEVQEGQEGHMLRKIGKAEIPTISQID